MQINNKSKNKIQWDQSISSKRGWLEINLKEIISYKDLIYHLVKRDFVIFYKQTILGPLWYIIQPLFMTVVFTLIFSRIANIPTDSVPPFIFYLAGNLMWGYFSTCLNQTGTLFVSNEYLFGKVYFPRICVPIANSIVSTIQFLIQFIIFVGFLIYFELSGANLEQSYLVFFLPLMIIHLAIISVGSGLIISALTAKYRDLTFAMTFFIQLWMFLTPIVYPLTEVPDKYRMLICINPMTAPVEIFRKAFLGQSSIEINELILSIFISIILFFIGLLLFNKVEKTFMDTV